MNIGSNVKVTGRQNTFEVVRLYEIAGIPSAKIVDWKNKLCLCHRVEDLRVI